MNTKNASKSIAYGQRRARAQRTFTYERMDNKTLELVRALSCIRSNQYDEVMKKLTKQASTHKPNGYSSQNNTHCAVRTLNLSIKEIKIEYNFLDKRTVEQLKQRQAIDYNSMQIVKMCVYGAQLFNIDTNIITIIIVRSSCICIGAPRTKKTT